MKLIDEKPQIMNKNLIYSVIAIILLFGIGFYLFNQRLIALFFQPTETTIQTGSNNALKNHNLIIAKHLSSPWEMAFLPDSSLLVTEREGRLQKFGAAEKTIAVPDVYVIGEGGLLGMALDPDFNNTRYIYLYQTTKKNGSLQNRIVRYTYNDQGRLDDKIIIFDGIPAARFHNGGRIAFGPDGYLYVTTGDAQSPSLAQDTNSLGGKILRITKHGEPAPGNPFNTAIYSYGHRNPQGLAWDNQGRLWSTEHGASGNDELNLIRPGGNYGWPVIEGNESKQGMVAPVIHSGKNETWAPTGIAYLDGRLFFGGLRGQTLYEATIDPEKAQVNQLRGHFRKQYGRIRNIIAAPDGFLYIMSSNRDGRGNPIADDDRIIRIDPAALGN